MNDKPQSKKTIIGDGHVTSYEMNRGFPSSEIDLQCPKCGTGHKIDLDAPRVPIICSCGSVIEIMG